MIFFGWDECEYRPFLIWFESENCLSFQALRVLRTVYYKIIKLNQFSVNPPRIKKKIGDTHHKAIHLGTYKHIISIQSSNNFLCIVYRASIYLRGVFGK